nr:hypothetical protein [Chloroflexota bacterium]
MQDKIYLQSRSRLQDYEPIVGRSSLEELRVLAEKLSGKIIQTINSTFVGGGVVEILEHMVPLLNQLGVDARWDVISGNEEFFEVTKKFHNALHGKRERISPEDFALFSEVTERNLEEIKFYGDYFFIHDPQPVALIAKKREIGKRWVWRVISLSPKPIRKDGGFFMYSFLDIKALFFFFPILFITCLFVCSFFSPLYT